MRTRADGQLAADLAEHYNMTLDEAIARLEQAIRLLPSAEKASVRGWANVRVTLLAADGAPVL